MLATCPACQQLQNCNKNVLSNLGDKKKFVKMTKFYKRIILSKREPSTCEKLSSKNKTKSSKKIERSSLRITILPQQKTSNRTNRSYMQEYLLVCVCNVSLLFHSYVSSYKGNTQVGTLDKCNSLPPLHFHLVLYICVSKSIKQDTRNMFL